MELEEIKKEVRGRLSENKWIHSVGVAKRIKELALIYGVDEKKAELVGITHDIAKQMSLEDSLQYVKENGIEIDEIEATTTALLHGKIGADIVKKKYHFSEDMQKAIEYHTTGNPNMDLLAQILFIADKTEENRKDEIPNLEEEVLLSNTNIEKAMVSLLDRTIIYTMKKRASLHLNTISTRNTFLKKCSE